MTNKQMRISRKVEILAGGQWLEIGFLDLKKGDLFRMFENSGESVDDGEISIAMEDAGLTLARDGTTNVGAVMCEPVGRKEIASEVDTQILGDVVEELNKNPTSLQKKIGQTMANEIIEGMTAPSITAIKERPQHREYYEWCPHGTFNPRACGACKSIRKPREDLERVRGLLGNLLEWAESRVGADELWPEVIIEARAELA